MEQNNTIDKPQEMEIKEPAVADKPFVGPKLPQEEIVNTATVEKIFENPENLKHIKVEGKVNSFWGVIKKGLEENEQFRGFTEAQKDNVISYFTNKGIGKEIGDPEKYGLTSDPDFGVKVETGKEIDLSKLLGDAEEVKKVLDGAAKKTLEEQQNILHKDAQIATYLQENPNVKLTNDTVAEILEQHGFANFSLSDIIREYCRSIGQETTRENLIAAGKYLRETYGNDYLPAQIIKKIREQKIENAVIVSLRHPDEINLLKKEPDFKLVIVDSPIEMRFERTQKRQGRPEDKDNFEEFKAHEDQERTGTAGGQQINAVMAIADLTIENTGTIEKLKEKVGKLIS